MSPVGTIPDMASHKKKRPGPPPSGGRRPAYTLYCRIEPALGAAFDRYLSETRPKPTATSAVELALENLLTAAGYWPPSEEGGDES